MIREVDLVSYLPPFIAEYKETNTTLTAENPEFVLVWKASDRVLQNEFIATADEYGIGRFEKILKILPSSEDTLESRRARVQSRWFTSLPYTWRMFIQKLIALCGENDFTIAKHFDFYRIALEVRLELFGQAEELERIIETMLPCNMVMDARNKIPMYAEGVTLAIGGACFVNRYLITNDWQERRRVEGGAAVGSGLTYAAEYHISNDSREKVLVRGEALHGACISDAVNVVITGDFNERFNVSGENLICAGIVSAEHIEIN